MPRYYTHYWKNDTWEKMAERLTTYLDGKLARAGSSLFERMKVKSGDHVYIVTDREGSFMLGGRIIVDRLLPQDEAQEYEDWDYCLPKWDKHIVMPLEEAGLFTPENKIPPETVKQLLFISGNKPRHPKLDEDNKLVRGTLGWMRELDKASAMLLEKYLG